MRTTRLEIYDVGAVDADEAFGVEAGFEADDGLLLQVLFAFAGQGHVVVLRFGVVELSDGNQSDARAVAHDDAVEELFGRASGCGEVGGGRHFFADAGFCAIESGIKAFAADRFQEIVDGVDFEGAHGVLVVSGDEDDGSFGADEFENVEAGKLGHLHIEKNQVGFVLGDGFDGFEAVGALGDHFDFWTELE